MLILGVILFAAALYGVYRWYKSAEATVAAEVEQDAGAVEAAVQTDVSTAEKVAAEVVADIKAKI